MKRYAVVCRVGFECSSAWLRRDATQQVHGNAVLQLGQLPCAAVSSWRRDDEDAAN